MTVDEYFQEYHHYFWQWEENADVIAIPDSNTITYKGLLLSIIVEIHPQGLPPFGALLLAIAALNPKGKESFSSIYAILERHIELIDNWSLTQTMDFMEKLSEIPEKYKTGNRKNMVLKTIFKDCHNILALDKSKQIFDSYSENAHIFQYLKKPFPSKSTINYDLRPLILLNRKFETAEDIIKEIANLPDFKEEITLEKQIGTEGTDFVEQLVNNHQTFKVGALIKMIWSGMNLPYHSYIPSQQPVGGVSDISNKGNLNQLIITEYANEDMVFLSRLANNEALYLNRESPPCTNEMKRVILIDVSIKNWGTPKIISFATMLAIAKHPKTDIECEAFVLGNSVKQIKFETIDDIIEALEIVELSLEPSTGLRNYFSEYAQLKNREIFVITEKTTQNSFNMAKVMADFGDKINYLIFNDSNGAIDIYKRLKNSKKHLQHLEIPLERLWARKPKFKSLPDSLTKYEYFPILVPASYNYYDIRPAENDELFLINKEKVLLRFHDRFKTKYQTGWEIIKTNLPIFDGDFEIGVTKKAEYILLLFKKHNRVITLLNISNGDEKTLIFPQWQWRVGCSFYFFNQKFHHYNDKGCWGIDQDGNVSEEKIERMKLYQLFKERDEKIKETKKNHISPGNILKNIKTIGINETGNIQINKHELIINSQGQIYFKLETHKEIKYKAIMKQNSFFEFYDGSIVHIYKTGIIILKSSDEAIPEIFIPSIVEGPLGLATKYDFTGKEFYQNSQMYELILHETGQQKLSLIKLIREYTAELKELEELTESIPVKIPLILNETEANKLKKNLIANGAKVEITVFNKNASKDVIDTYDFYRKYIVEFIETITNHEA